MARTLFRLTSMALILASCGSSPNAPGVGRITKGEADALNEAAEMLDNQAAHDAVAPAPQPLKK
jgi:hypothetical protein